MHDCPHPDCVLQITWEEFCCPEHWAQLTPDLRRAAADERARYVAGHGDGDSIDALHELARNHWATIPALVLPTLDEFIDMCTKVGIELQPWQIEIVRRRLHPDDIRPHSRACGIRRHDHGPDCHINCPTCHGGR